MYSQFLSIPIGARFMILSAFAFSVMALLVKMVGQHGIPILEVVLARSLISIVLSVGSLRRKKIPMLGHRRGMLLMRGLVGFIALNAVFYGITYLPLAEATTIQFLYPLFTALIGVLFVKEKMSSGLLGCLILSFIGLLVMVSPELFSESKEKTYGVVPVLVALAGAFGSAVAYILVRELGKTEDPLVIVMYFPMVSLPVSIIMLWGEFVIPQGVQWVLLIAIGLCTHIGQVALTKAMKTETASNAGSYGYLQVVFAVVFGMVIFQEFPSIEAVIGIGLILFGVYLNVSEQRKINRQ